MRCRRSLLYLKGLKTLAIVAIVLSSIALNLTRFIGSRSTAVNQSERARITRLRERIDQDVRAMDTENELLATNRSYLSGFNSKEFERTRQSPSLKIQQVAIIVVTDQVAYQTPWIESRLKHFQCYADAHGYTFIHHILGTQLLDGVSFYAARWEAIFKGYWGQYDWIFTHDTDSMYPDFSINLDRFTLATENAEIHMLARGVELGANALLFRASESRFTERFMRRFIDLGHRKPRPTPSTNYDVRDIMLTVLEYAYPDLAELCCVIDDFHEFSKCFTPFMEHMHSLPTEDVPVAIHGPMSGFVQQFESPSNDYGLLFGACWPGHVLLSGNGVKGDGPVPLDAGHACARDKNMRTQCHWLTLEEQREAARKCCLTQASVCLDDPDGCMRHDHLICRTGWPTLWAGGGEVKERHLPSCDAPFIKLIRPGIDWDTMTYLNEYKMRLQSRTTHISY